MQTAILFLFLFFALFMLFVITSAFIGFVITRVPFVPTYASDIKFIVDKLGITERDVFYDLGSGNGKVVFLVNRLTGARCVGFELTWWTHWWAKIKKWSLQSFSPSRRSAAVRLRRTEEDGGDVALATERVQFINGNFFKQDWSGANIIYCYLYPPLMQRIEDKFKAEMKPGSIAIVRDFPFPKMPHAEKYYLPKEHEIYVYKI